MPPLKAVFKFYTDWDVFFCKQIYRKFSMNIQHIKTKQRLEPSYVNCVHKYTEPIPRPTSRGISSYMPRWFQTRREGKLWISIELSLICGGFGMSFPFSFFVSIKWICIPIYLGCLFVKVDTEKHFIFLLYYTACY